MPEVTRATASNFVTDYMTPLKMLTCQIVDATPSIDLLPLVLSGDAEQTVDLYFTKSTVWRYEREWRIIHRHAGTLYRYPIHALKAVYFGISITQSDLENVARPHESRTLRLGCGRESKTRTSLRSILRSSHKTRRCPIPDVLRWRVRTPVEESNLGSVPPACRCFADMTRLVHVFKTMNQESQGEAAILRRLRLVLD